MAKLIIREILVYFFQVTTEVTGIVVTPSPQKGNAQFKWLSSLLLFCFSLF